MLDELGTAVLHRPQPSSAVPGARPDADVDGGVGPPWSPAMVGLLMGACAVVPSIFTTRLDDVFYLPKLVALWIVLVAAAWMVVLGALRSVGGGRWRLELVAAVDYPMAAFVLLIVLSTALSTDRHQSLFGERLQHQGLLTMLLYVAFFYAARLAVDTLRRLRLVLLAVTVGGLAVSVYAVAQRLGLDPIWKGYLPAGRVFSTIGQSNALAAYLVLALCAAGMLGAGRPRRVQVAVALSGALMLAALAFTLSRGGYLGLAAAGLVGAYGWLRATSLPRRTIVAGAGAAVALLAGLLLLTPARSAADQTWHRLQSVTRLGGDVSIGNHLDQWKVAVRIVEDHPLLGTGPETYPEQFPAYSRKVLPATDVAYFSQFRVESPHDQVLAVASGSGIPAAVAYLLVLAGVATTLWRRARRMAAPGRLLLVAVVAAVVGHVVTDSFMSAEVTGSWLCWVCMGAGVGVASSRRRARTDEPTPDPALSVG